MNEHEPESYLDCVGIQTCQIESRLFYKMPTQIQIKNIIFNIHLWNK